VVVTDVGGFREVIDETRAGVVVPPNDPVALAEAVAWLLGDEILRDGYAAAARAAAAGPYGWDAIAGETEAIYRGVGAGA
jgi:glycosyltransferase involved in cell wall biosynthesis